LTQRDLTAAQRAKLVAKRKAAYEAVHPETKPGGDRRSNRQNGGLKDSFAKDTAAKSGKPLRTVERDITRGRKLGSDLDRLVGTSLDKGAPN
jgi:ParB family chromosome partitioning protein